MANWVLVTVEVPRRLYELGKDTRLLLQGETIR